MTDTSKHIPTTKSKSELDAMSERDWQVALDTASYHVLRQKGTERPFSGAYTNQFADGSYYCKGCHAKLFDSARKFDAGCGWPSFDQTATADALTETLDLSHGMRRTEVTCSNCGGHLGHVFTDGPAETTGLRYCINSVALDFIPDELDS